MDFETKSANCPICRGDVEHYADVIAGLAVTPERIAAALDAAPPHSGDGWSAPEVVAHLADTEVVRGWRIRRIIGEEAPVVESFDEKTWATTFRYPERDLATSLATLTANRQANLELLRIAGEGALTRTWRHPEKGVLTLNDLVNHTSDHDLAHLRQIVGT